jgi:hypothetical protein
MELFILMKNHIKQHYRTNQELKESKKSCLFAVFLLEQPISLQETLRFPPFYLCKFNSALFVHYSYSIG